MELSFHLPSIWCYGVIARVVITAGSAELCFTQLYCRQTRSHDSLQKQRLYGELVRVNSAFKSPMRNSWSRQHCPSLCLGKEGAAVLAQAAGEPCSELVTDLQSKLPSPRSFLAALQRLLDCATSLSSGILHLCLIPCSTGNPRSKPCCCMSYRRSGNTGPLHKSISFLLSEV